MLKEKTIKAVFQGKDGSLGYKNGGIYKLIIRKFDDGGLTAISVGWEQACEYGSEKSFLQNWMTSRQILLEKTGNPTI